MMLLGALKNMIKSLPFWLGYFSGILVISIIAFMKGDNATLRIEAVMAIIGLIMLACMGSVSLYRRIRNYMWERYVFSSDHPHSRFYKGNQR